MLLSGVRLIQPEVGSGYVGWPSSDRTYKVGMQFDENGPVSVPNHPETLSRLLPSQSTFGGWLSDKKKHTIKMIPSTHSIEIKLDWYLEFELGNSIRPHDLQGRRYSPQFLNLIGFFALLDYAVLGSACVYDQMYDQRQSMKKGRTDRSITFHIPCNSSVLRHSNCSAKAPS